MKNLKFKNCIAFTLAEMTLVLLITSIIAAASTPMLTSAITGSAGGKDVDVAATYDTPWKNASSYNGGGIYNSPRQRTSIISIGHKTGAAPSSYEYPSLLVHQNSTNSFFRAPQIEIIPTNTTSPTGSYTNIAMDEFQNLAITYGSSFQAYKNTNNNVFMGLSNIFLGSYINPTLAGGNFRSSIFMGYGVDVSYSQYSMAIGSNIYAYNGLRQSILIGSNIKPYANKNIWDSTMIGHYAGYNAYGITDHVYIGSYAGASINYANNASRNVMIGDHAGQNLFRYTQYASAMENAFIGSYSGYVSELSATIKYAGMSGNNYIGKYAGSVMGTQSSTNSNSLVARDNIAIGSYAGSYDFTEYSILSQENNISLGNYAGYTKAYPKSTSYPTLVRRICIGQNACYNGNVKYQGTHVFDINSPYSVLGSNNIFIGESAGRESADGGFNIGIGNFAGSYTYSDLTTKYAISIGEYAGSRAHSLYSIFIGHNAGYGSMNANNYNYYFFPKRLVNLAIGNNTCKGVTFGGKTCIGSGTLDNEYKYVTRVIFGMYPDFNTSYTYSTAYAWSKSRYNPQMVIGFVDKGLANQSIIFYASMLIRGGYSMSNFNIKQAANWQLSDRRLKKDIVPTSHSIDDIRKVNIYDFNYKNDKDKTKNTGIIAQEYKKIFPYDVTVEPTSKKLSANSDWLLFTLVNAIKSVDKEIADLQKDVKAYIESFMGLKEKVAKLEKQAEKIKAENKQLRNHLAKINAKIK